MGLDSGFSSYWLCVTLMSLFLLSGGITIAHFVQCCCEIQWVKAHKEWNTNLAYTLTEVYLLLLYSDSMTFENLKPCETCGKEIEKPGGEWWKWQAVVISAVGCLIQKRAGCEHYSGEAGDGKIFYYRIREDLYDVRVKQSLVDSVSYYGKPKMSLFIFSSSWVS